MKCQKAGHVAHEREMGNA